MVKSIDFRDPDTGKTIQFAVEEQTTLNGVNYLLVSEEEDAYILKEVASAGEEGAEDITYEMVEDDVEFEALARIFSELLDEDTDLEY